MLNWLIVGGGIHGTYLSHLLVHQAGLDRETVRVIDPWKTPLASWNRNTANCGMRFLRSPATHNIDIPVLSLYRFAKSRSNKETAAFIPPYNRPALSLFKNHSQHVIREFRLGELRIRGRALALHKNRRSITAATSTGPIAARNVILAIGMGEQPCWPVWAQRLRQHGARIHHLFESEFRIAGIPDDTECVVVVGGGISAAQTALMLAARLTGTVWVVSPHAPRESPYDFDPCWIGPKCLRDFYRQDYDRRRVTVDRSRLSGTLPGEVMAELRRAISAKRLRFQTAFIREATRDAHRIRLDTDRGPIWADNVLLATGFRSQRPGGGFIDQVIQEFGLRCGPCGYPIVGEDLRWSANLFVTGPLAELQLGPCARNIIGARNAGRHLLKALETKH